MSRYEKQIECNECGKIVESDMGLPAGWTWARVDDARNDHFCPECTAHEVLHGAYVIAGRELVK